MKYEEGTLNFQGLTISWKLITTETENGKTHEVFNIEFQNGKEKIRQEFHNSIMEFELSEKLKDARERMSYTEFLKAINSGFFRPHMWAGYDEDLNEKKLRGFDNLIKKRLWWFLYSVINDFSMYIDYNDYYDFNWFCDCYGYDKDSRKAEQIHNSCINYHEKISSLNLSEKQRDYFLNESNQETQKFSDDLKKAILEQY